jgi:hypothetical protein
LSPRETLFAPPFAFNKPIDNFRGGFAEDVLLVSDTDEDVEGEGAADEEDRGSDE